LKCKLTDYSVRYSKFKCDLIIDVVYNFCLNSLFWKCMFRLPVNSSHSQVT